MATPSPCRTNSSLAGSGRCSLASSCNDKDLISLPHHEAQQDPLLGCSIHKSFGGRSYYGHVVSIDIDSNTGERHYHVTYEDGDEEHMLAPEIQPLVQPGRVGFAGGRLSSGPGSPACRPSFSASRAGTPGRRSVLGGEAASGSGDEGAGLGIWWALAAIMIALYAMVWGVPSFISGGTAHSKKPLDLDTGFDLSETPAWVLPSNEDLLGSLPLSGSPSATPAGGSPMPSYVAPTPDLLQAQPDPLVTQPEPSPTVHSWRPLQMPDGTSNFAIHHSWEEAPEGKATTNEAGEQAETSLADFAESTAAVAIVAGLITFGLILIIGTSFQLPGLGSSSLLCGPQDGRQVQVGLFYLANVGSEQKVVKTTMLNSNSTVSVEECSLSWSGNGVPTFNATQKSCTVPVADLLQGPFVISGGRAPEQISRLFQQANVENMPHHQFKYLGAVRKMEERGFADCPELRDVIAACDGNVNEVLKEFWR